MNKPSQIRLHDIARLLNVSSMTVSKALRNHPDISEKTKQQVKMYAEELGYTPNFSARNLSSQKSQTIGLVVPQIGNSFYPTIVKSIYQIAYGNGYNVLLMISFENAEQEIKEIKTLLSMRVDGLLISISEQTKERQVFQTIRRLGVPLVFFDRVIEDLKFSYIKFNDHEAAFRIVEQVIKVGYTRIAHLAGFSHISIGRDRCAGYIDAMRRHNLPIPKLWLIESGFTEEHGYHGFMNLYKNRNLPEIIFAVTSTVAIGVYRAALDVGLKIPGDVNIISIGKTPLGLMTSSTAYIDLPIDEMGKKAVEILIEEMNHAETSIPKQIILSAELKNQENSFSKNK